MAAGRADGGPGYYCGMEKRIKQSELFEAMQQKDRSGGYKYFSFAYVRLNESREGNGEAGSIVRYEAAVFSSMFSDGDTVNIRIRGQRFPRKFLRCMIIEFNGKKVYA